MVAQQEQCESGDEDVSDMSYKEKLELADAEVARLRNIVKIQCKQIERLMDARDIEKARGDELEARIANALL